MSGNGNIPTDFAEWIIRSLDGTITTEQFVMLDHEITANSAARAYYLEFITTYVGLVDLVGVLPKVDEFVEQKTPDKKNIVALNFRPGMSDEEKIRMIERYAHQQLAEFLTQEHREYYQKQHRSAGWDLSDVLGRVSGGAQWLLRTGSRVAKTAAVLSLMGLIVLILALYIHANRTVAILVDSVNAKWSVDIGKETRLRPRNMRLEQGYARIVLNKGVDVILQAPSTFKVQSSNKMFLESGWITAKVPGQAMGFIVQTPASSVVDYGTEFGLLVGAKNNTEVHVFEGSIGVASDTPRADARSSKYHQTLMKGETATIDTTGHIDCSTVVDRPRLFSHSIPTSGVFGIPGVRLDLADMVGGGNGLGTGILGQCINPSTGEIVPGRKVLHGLDHGFMKVPSLLFVDGVFIPDSNDGPAVISSTGVVFENCPKTLGKCYETIINGAVFRAGSLDLHFGRLAGRMFGTKDSPSIGMHPNTGITFDLDKIRSSMPNVEISRFRALCGVSETAAQYAARDSDPNQIKVDFWVLVDGRIKFSRKLVAVPSQAEKIDIPIGPNDRFLTLATTNPGNYLYCWSMFAEPMLDLNKK
jgi:hypothetical protein